MSTEVDGVRPSQSRENYKIHERVSNGSGTLRVSFHYQRRISQDFSGTLLRRLLFYNFKCMNKIE